MKLGIRYLVCGVIALSLSLATVLTVVRLA
jgi:hypothetical protein